MHLFDSLVADRPFSECGLWLLYFPLLKFTVNAHMVFLVFPTCLCLWSIWALELSLFSKILLEPQDPYFLCALQMSSADINALWYMCTRQSLLTWGEVPNWPACLFQDFLSPGTPVLRLEPCLASLLRLLSLWAGALSSPQQSIAGVYSDGLILAEPDF